MKNSMVCPWWAGHMLAGSVRALFHNPEQLLKPYLREGMTVMDVGCGMGFFSLTMANMVGPRGRVIAVDIQDKMLTGLMQKAVQSGTQNQIQPHVCKNTFLCLDNWKESIDFALIFMMLHEVPDRQRLIQELYAALKAGGKLLFAEPIVHVNRKDYLQSIAMLKEVGFHIVSTPRIPICRAALLEKAHE